MVMVLKEWEVELLDGYIREEIDKVEKFEFLNIFEIFLLSEVVFVYIIFRFIF